MTGRKRRPVVGEIPNPLEPPAGCPFHPRCPFQNERCRREPPRLAPAAGRPVACHGVHEGRI
jgi:peptide/nickel transport system ATP-binding protein